MKQTDADRLDKLAKAYSTNANYCRHLAEGARDRSSKEHWVRLTASWAKLAEAEKAKARSLDSACPSVPSMKLRKGPW
jgi:uncharacterized alpha-E superfamily protein